MGNDKTKTPLESVIADIVGERRGHKQGISVKQLAMICGCSERKAREVVSDLVIEHGQRIGSHPQFGFFAIVDREDLELAEENLRPRALAILKRWSVLRKQTVAEVVGQLLLPAIEEAHRDAEGGDAA